MKAGEDRSNPRSWIRTPWLGSVGLLLRRSRMLMRLEQRKRRRPYEQRIFAWPRGGGEPQHGASVQQASAEKHPAPSRVGGRGRRPPRSDRPAPFARRQGPNPAKSPQVHLIHEELHDELRADGFQVTPGAIGENTTTRGIDLLALPRGARLHIGGAAVVGVNGLRHLCRQLNDYQPGLMAAVLSRDEQGNLVPLHRGFDWLSVVHRRTGRCSGSTSISILRATPRCRRMNPARSSVSTIWR